MTAEIEDILECETAIDPSDLLDKEEALEISMANFKSVPDDMMKELTDIVKHEMKDVWAKHKWDIGLTHKIKHDIQTEEGKFVRDKKRPIPYPRLQYAKKAVNTLMKYKLVTPAYTSKWATNLVLVQKPTEGNLRDTTKASKIHNRKENVKCTWRLTQDLRGVNAETKNIFTATLPTIDEIVSKCRNKIVTQFDINQAYFTVPLTDSSREKTSFYLNDSMYCWERMTQGLAGAPHTWMKFMQLIYCDKTLKEYKEAFPEKGKLLKEEHWTDFLSIYMDDLDIFSDNYKEHIIHIHAVLWIMKREKCLLNPKKAIFMTTHFNCLGVTINTKENNVSIDKKRAQAILSWPKPSSLLEVMSRIQSLNYLSKNLPKLKEIAYPLLTLLRNKEFVWEKEHQTSWEHLKQLIRMDIRLTIPNDTLEYVTSSDTSKIAVAGNLWNYDPKNGKLYLLGCMSKLLSISDSLKPPFHKECLAMCLNLKTWEAYILGTSMRITALCDARGVMWLHRNKEFSNKLATISLYISQFRNLVIWHIPGTQNQLADIFSRSYHGSAHKTKGDFKLSKEQASRLPPLPIPCILSADDLFKIFTTLPQPEPDFDTGNKKRRPLPTPKPLLNIMKNLEEATPEEKFVSARRILAGWNDSTLDSESTDCNMIHIYSATLIETFANLEHEIENEYIQLLHKYIKQNKTTEYGDSLDKQLEQIISGETNNEEKMKTLKEINSLLPIQVKNGMKEKIIGTMFEDKITQPNTIYYIKLTDIAMTPIISETHKEILIKTPHDIHIKANEQKSLHTGITLKIPIDRCISLTSPKEDMEITSVTNWTENYNFGELTLLLRNTSQNNILIKKGELVGQCEVIKFDETKEYKEIRNSKIKKTKNEETCHYTLQEVQKNQYTMLLDIISPNYKLINQETNIQIKIPQNQMEKEECEQTLQQSTDENLTKESTVINILEIINETNINEGPKISEEKMMAAISDIFGNRGKLSADTLDKFQNSDTFCGKIKNKLKKGIKQPSFSIMQNILIKTEYDKIRGKYLIKIVLPDDIMPMICKEIHNIKTIHQPITGSITKFRKHFYNRNLIAHMKRTIDNCIICKYTEKPTGRAAPGPGKTRTLIMENLKPREAIALDLAVSLPLTRNQSCHALTVICLKTNYGQI